MPTKSSSSQGGRSSANIDAEAVKESLDICKLQLEGVAEKIARNDENVSEDVLATWRSKVTTLAQDLVRVGKLEDITRENIAKFQSTQQRDDDFSMESSEISMQIRVESQKRCAEMNPKKDPEYQKLVGLIQEPDMGDDDDLDIAVVQHASTEEDFKCPYTGMKMVDPMKCTECIHHLSRVAFEAILKSRKRGGNCPVPGCTATWTHKNTSYDSQFQYKMDRFYRSQGRSQSSKPSNTESTVLDVE